MPKVSVVIPTYNRKDTLGEAIDSVLNQTFKDFEIIVVDHGSTDGSYEWMAQSYGSKIHPLRLEFCPLPACPRNAGIHAAQGEYVSFLDSDDLWLPNKLALQVAGMDADPKLGWSYGKVERFGGGQDGIPEIGWWQLHSGPVFETLLLGNVIPSCTVLARASALKAVGDFDMAPELRIAEDYELWMRLAHRFPVFPVNETIARYRVASDNLSGSLAARFNPEKAALESIQRKLKVPEPLMRRALAALHLRHFRYNVSVNPSAALTHLESSWALDPRPLRTVLYKAAATLGGAAAAGRLIAAEKWLKRRFA